MDEKTKKIKDEIISNPDKVLNDNSKMKTVISDPDLTLKLLEEKEVKKLNIQVDGKEVELIDGRKPINPPGIRARLYMPISKN